MNYENIPTSEYYPILALASKLPGRRPGKRLAKRTIERWRAAGLHRAGVCVKLKAVRIGNDWRTCDQWVAEFLQTVNAGDATAAAVRADRPAPRTPDQRQRASSRAREELERRWRKSA